ncbi:MAG TPA: ABC transporter ATP-binding protein [Candidatus Polarisedimenticolia bacterium]|nr:ABC transporter ATP-binding protein [Candidatus Polarisedimenticolia bacterium]
MRGGARGGHGVPGARAAGAGAPLPDDELPGRVYDARLARRLLAFVRPEAGLIALSIAFMFAVMGASLVQPWLIKRLIDEHIVPGKPEGVAAFALLYLAAFAVELLARYAQIYTMERTGQNVIQALRVQVFARMQRLDMAFFDRNPVGRLMTRVTTDVESLADLFASGTVTLLGDAAKLVAIVGILFWLDPRLALVTCTIVPLLFALSVLFRGRIRQAYRDVRRRVARINAFLQEAVSGMMLTQLFRREEEDRRDFTAINEDHRDAELRSVVYESSFSAVVELVGTVATAAILWSGGARVLSSALTFGTLVAFLEYTARFFQPIRDLSGFYAVLQSAMASLERLFDLLDTEPSVVDGPREVRAAAGAAAGRVEFDHVGFSYLPEEPVLSDVSFTVEPGQTVAIVGATGAGKTTVVKLLIRLYDPTGGSIRLDGVDLRDRPVHEVRRQCGLVMQDHFLIAGTVAENIAFGDLSLSRQRIEAAARLVHADRFVRALPHGYDEPLRERGGNLSVGQKQLLSLARAVAADPPILILDEATSSIDSETEALIQDALAQVMRGRTSLVIAHRLSTILAADRILVFHHGRIVEEGRHRELLAKRGVYARLYELQFGLAEGTAFQSGRPERADPLPVPSQP